MSDTRTHMLDGAPPEVSAWLQEHFDSVIIIGFRCDGSACDLIYAADTKSRFALYESMRRTIAANEIPTPIVLDEEDGDES